MSGNHDKENHYKPGAMIHYESITMPGADVQLDIVGSWETVVDSLAADFRFPVYSPPVDSHAEITLTTASAHSAANSPYLFGIFDGGTKLIGGYLHVPTANGYSHDVFVWSNDTASPLLAGVNYNFIVKYYNITGGTHIHLWAGLDTRLTLKVWRIP